MLIYCNDYAWNCWSSMVFWNLPEIGGLLFFLGIFIYTVFSSFAKADPIPKGNPFFRRK